MNKEILAFFKEAKNKMKEDNLNLKHTKTAVKYWREAETLIMHGDFRHQYRNELFNYIELMAKKEWGEGTTVDDFSLPGKIIIKSGRREEIL